MKKLLIALMFLGIFSCSKKEKEVTAESSYIDAMKLLQDKSYAEAAKNFEKISDDFPFSKWSAQAQTIAAYAYYKNEDYEDVARVVDDFVRINPNHKSADYMLYMKALSYYNQMPNIHRAQDKTQLASTTFRELNARFPNSNYYADVNEKLEIVDEHLAGALMSIGRYEISQQNYVGAIKNFQHVINRYRYTNQVPEAYFRLFEIYKKLGVAKEAEKSYQNLIMKFPQNQWIELAQKIHE